MIIDREKLAWAAGLFEGEGSFIFTSSKRTKRKACARLSITDEDVIREFHNVINLGTVYGPRTIKSGNKPVWEWTTTSFEDAQTVVCLLWPWLKGRRRQAAKDMLVRYHKTITFPRKRFTLAKRHTVIEHEAIKKLYLAGAKQSELARQFNRSPASICLIVNDKRLGKVG